MNGKSSSRIAQHSLISRARIPTVEEALQYSPFTSVVPFSPGPALAAPSLSKTQNGSNIPLKSGETPRTTQPHAASYMVSRHATSCTSAGSTVLTRDSPIKPAVVVPDFPPSSNPGQYEKFPDVDAAIIQEFIANSPKQMRHSRVHLHGNDSASDLHAQSDVAVSKLQELVLDIFEAEELVGSGESMTTSDKAHKYFSNNQSSDAAVPLLLPEIQSRLERSLSMVIDAGRFSEIPFDHLIRLQKLCAAPLNLTLEQAFEFPANLQDESYEEWTKSIQSADSSLRASRLLLKMISADGQEKLLFSEENLQLVLNSLKHIIDSCVIPIVEKRIAGSEKSLLQSNSDHLKSLGALFQRVGSVLRLLGNVILKFDLSETAVTTIEFFTLRLVFVENAPFEKDSLIGIQRFEAVRRHAMDVVAKIFLRHLEHRSFVIDEILSSLEKLPVTRQNARHFKIKDGKPIQLVSALIMQLVQTSAVSFTKKLRRIIDSALDENASSASEDEARSVSPSTKSHPSINQLNCSSSQRRAQSDDGIVTLSRTANPLFDGAQSNSSYVVKYLVHRAMSSTKSGDQPYRNLLDIFTEDFISVLGSPDWPAAELLLRALLSSLIGLAENEKGGAPAKNMALDIMGTMGSGIADLRNMIYRASQNVENTNSMFGKILPRLCEEVLQGNSMDLGLVKLDGVCHMAAMYYADIDSDDLQTQSSRDYFLAQWARNLCTTYDAATQQTMVTGVEKSFQNAAVWLSNAIRNPESTIDDESFPELSASDIRMCHALNMINMPFCSAFRRLIGILLASLSSSHATVRSRSLKSVVQLLEQDATILDRFGNVLKHIVHSASDSSPLVRDSALSLLGKCMTLQPSLESEICKALIPKTLDAATGVRKRAMKLLKDIYVRNANEDVRASIVDTILHRVTDEEDSVSELARTLVEEMWFIPFNIESADAVLSPQAKHKFRQHTSHVIYTVGQNPDILSDLETLLKALLTNGYKNLEANRQISGHLIAVLFDDIIDNDTTTGSNSQHNILQVLTLFAKTCPHLFTCEQMVTLRPYIENLSSDDLLVYRAVLVIYRCVLPVLPPLQHDFLRGVQAVLFNSIPRLKRLELEELSGCLWIIDRVLQNTERLVRLMISVLGALEGAQKQDLTEPSKDSTTMYNKVMRYITIAGCFGKTCNLDSQEDAFRKRFPWWKGNSVSGLVVDLLCPFANRNQPLLIREAALESMCLVCHTNPASFIKQQVSATISDALLARNGRLERVILSGVKAFYNSEENRSRSTTETVVGEGAANGAERLGKSMVLSDNDGATTSIAQQYLPHILRIALSSNDDLAVLATEVIASTNRQGLVHPKETGPALVALATSSNTTIAEIALIEHRNLHAKHESMLEKEYLTAIDQAFLYQKDTVRDVSGLDAQRQPKLRAFYEVLKTGSAGIRKKLLSNLISRVDVDPNKPRSADSMDGHILFVRFVLENLGLFEYSRIDELLHLLRCMEKIFAKSGNILAHSVETVLHTPGRSKDSEMGTAPPVQGSLQHHSLRHITSCSMILAMIWETRVYLRKAWNLQSSRDGKAKPAAKDVSKAPIRYGQVSAESFIEKVAKIMGALDTTETMMKQCQLFMDIFSVDNELKVGSGEDEDKEAALRYETPSEDADGDRDTPTKALGGSGRGTKRKGSVSARTTPSKPRKKGRPSAGSRKRTGSKGNDDEDEQEDG